MKKLILFSILLLVLPISSAASIKDVTINLGDSYLLDGKNLTLVKSSDESTFLCINKEEIIVSKDRRVQGIFIDYRGSDESKAKFSLDYDCDKDCTCDGDECNNDECVQGILNIGVKDEDQELEEVGCTEDLDCDDFDSCNIDICLNGLCFYQAVEGCGIDESAVQAEEEGKDIFIMKFLAYFLLAIVIVLTAISIAKVLRK